jgi:hypothetical protein
MENKCFALTANGRCRALNCNADCGDTCAFYKTSEQNENEHRCVKDRLATLDPEYQSYIAEKYHQGWKILQERGAAR